MIKQKSNAVLYYDTLRYSSSKRQTSSNMAG